MGYNIGMLDARMVYLDELVELAGNAKDHDIGAIWDSIGEFGFLERVVINDVTGHMISGHGRVYGLREMYIGGISPPEGVDVGEGGRWMIPADGCRVEEGKERAAAIALNRTVELGGWDMELLREELEERARLGEEGFRGIGFDMEDLEQLRRELDGVSRGEGEEERVDQETITSQWMVVIECRDESEQVELIDRMSQEGYKVRALVG